MTKYILRRVLQAIPVLFVISLILFTITQVLPDKPWALLLHNPRLTLADRLRILHYYGFDQPFWLQYFLYMKHLLSLPPDLGSSARGRRGCAAGAGGGHAALHVLTGRRGYLCLCAGSLNRLRKKRL